MKKVIGIGDAFISKSSEDLLITHSLGSCLGVGLYDPVAKVGAIAHFMLPQPNGSIDLNRYSVYRFTSEGIPHLFQETFRLGATKETLRVVMAGGANVLKASNLFDVGHRNFTLAKKLFWKNRVFVEIEDVGGDMPRTLSLDMSQGEFYIQKQGKKFLFRG